MGGGQQKALGVYSSNAGAYYFEDRCDLSRLHEINWAAVQARTWSGRGISTLVKEGKQAEFLVAECFPWTLVERIGVSSKGIGQQAATAISRAKHRPTVGKDGLVLLARRRLR